MGRRSTPALEPPDQAELFRGALGQRKFRRRLLAWFARSKRDLPWRKAPSDYAVWISEIMLQQTQVATVIPYFQRFLARFPTLERLAAAREEQVLALWEGLGYYRRARQLYRAAQRCVEAHDGRLPSEREALRELPGIGRYTAGAILSIAHDQREPILEANTYRLWARLLAFRGDPRSKVGERELWRAAEAILPPARRGCGEVNQALMELGATVCLPRADCPRCPVAEFCAARAAGLQESIPPPLARPATEQRWEAAIVVQSPRGVLLARCEDGGRWAGLWDFPRFVLAESQHTDQQRAALESAVHKRTGHRVALGERITSMRHGVTRFRITLDCYAARLVRSPRRLPAGVRWVGLDELGSFPMNVTARRLAKLLAGSQAKQRP